MKKLMKWIIRAITAVVGLLVVLVVVALVVFDGDKIKTELAERVKNRTSVDLMIENELELSFFPWLSVETGQVKLSQPEGFISDLAFAEIGSFKANIKLLPLLGGNIEIGAVELDKLELNLIQDVKGKSNLEQVANYSNSQSKERSAQEVAKTEVDPAKTVFSIQKLSLNDVQVNHYSSNRKHKETLKQKFSVERFELNNFAPDTFIPVLANGELTSTSGNSNSRWELQSQIKVSQDFKRIELQALSATLDNLSKQIKQLNFTGNSVVAISDDKTLLEHQGNIRLNDQVMALTFNGALSSFKDINLSLSGQELDLQTWVESEGSTPSEASPMADFTPIADFLKGARIKGQISFDTLKVRNMTFSQVKGQVFNKGATLWLKPFNAKAFKGSLGTSASINFAAKPIALSVQPNLKNIEVGDLLAHVFEVERLSGLGTLELNMKSQGLTFKQILQNLNGNGKIDLSDGALNGLNLNKLIESGISLELLNNRDAYKGKTDFAALAGKIVANKGVIKLNDFSMKSPLFELLGKASTDANKETIAGNFQLLLKGQLKTLLEQKYPQLSGKNLPLKIKGSWQEPKATIDFESLLKDELKDRLGGKVEDKKKELEDKLKDKLKDSLFDKIKGK